MRWTRFFAGDAWIPWTFVAMFAVVFAVNGVMVMVGIWSWPGLTDNDHFRRGPDYNEYLAERRDEADLGWVVAFQADRAEHGRVTLRVTATGPDGRPVPADTVRAVLRRPTHAGIDAAADLARGGDGVWAGALANLPAGQWDLEITVHAEGRRHRSRERIFLAATNP